MKHTVLAASLLAFGATLAVTPSVEASAGAPGGPASDSLEDGIALEQTLVGEDLEEHEKLSGRRIQIQVRLQNLYAGVDHMIGEGPDISVTALEELTRQIEDAERERNQVLMSQRFLVHDLVERLRRIALLEERLGTLKEREEADAGPLAGSWQVVLLPNTQRGSFRLTQTGTLVSGTYALEGGWTGSLQGTLVNRKVYLVRIDSRLGRSMELQGTLSEDGETIVGSWLNYDLSAETGGQGEWKATRSE